MIDSLTLDEAEWSSLAPPRLALGSEWPVSDRLARRLCRLLSPSSDQSGMPRPEEVASVRLSGKVQSIEKGVARLSFDGRISAIHTNLGKDSFAAARLTGVGDYNASTGRLLSFLLVSEGKYRAAPPYDKDLRTTAAAVEWRRDPMPSR